MRTNRVHDRFIRRLETEFTADNKSYRGISSDLSISGLFIRTNHAFVPDTIVDIVIHLPDAANVKLKGRVKHANKTPVVSLKNGMGIEILENDPRYINFVRTVFPEAQEKISPERPQSGPSFQKHTDQTSPEPQPPEFTIIVCPRCNVKNKVNNAKLPQGPICGKCRYPLTAQA